MDNINSTEMMLAEIIENANGQSKQITKMNTAMEQIASDLNQLIITNGSQAIQQETQSVITLKDHEDKMKSFKKDMQTLYNQYLSIQARYRVLQETKRYWSTQQWAKHFFRWLFVKRHLWIWLIYAFYNGILLFTLYTYSQQKVEIDSYREEEIKYRYLKALGVAPNVMQTLDDAFTNEDTRTIRAIYATVDNYEKALKQKSDSIVRVEQKKIELLK